MTFDVVIAGAGPVGLFLACELRLGGASVLVLEREPTADSTLKKMPFGMRGLTVPSVEAFHRRGLLKEFSTTALGGRRQAGHFAGIAFDADRIDTSRWDYQLSGPAATNLPAELAHVEDVLAKRALALGAEIRRGEEVRDFEASDSGITLRTRADTVAASWLVGCDGGRSTVRRIAGFSFEGTEPNATGYNFQVDLADPASLPLGRHLTPHGFYYQMRPGHVGMLDFDGGAFHRSAPVTLQHLESVLRRVSGTNVTLTALQVATTWTDRAYQATSYRRGRVLLAGDAAHIHSPLGGQGLNTGFGDAMNLGWKLAATIRGTAPPGLIDTYETERHPVGAAVLDWSRAQIALIKPAPESRALERIVRDVIATKDGVNYFVERAWGVALRYDLGGAHPLVGRSAPDFELSDGTRLGELLRDGKGLLLDFADDPALRELGVRYIAASAQERFDVDALLVRPDGVVAWVRAGAPDRDGARAAIRRWLSAG